MKKEHDFIIVGSGAGGGALAHALSRKGKKILIIERGPTIQQAAMGNFLQAIPYYEGWALSRSVEGTMIYRTSNAGGTTVFSCGNMVRSLQQEFLSFGINLEPYFVEAEKEMCVAPLDMKKIVGGSKIIRETSQNLGYDMKSMPKGFYSSQFCDLCGNCVFGCHSSAKWDARPYLDEALKNGAELMTLTRVEKILFDGTRAIGVEVSTGGSKQCIYGNSVILAAGGIGTPIILQKSNISAGNGLFIDPFEITCGISKGKTQVKGPSMAAVYQGDGFILSPFVDHWSQMLIFYDLGWDLKNLFPQSRVLSIMTKIADERSGKVEVNGKISKTLTEQDRQLLEKGAIISRGIFIAAGVDTGTIITTTRRARGAHPGGTAAIGEVVKNDLSVKGCEGLFICDCSVFPVSPGHPPILTIVALAKWLADQL